jgi:hypothetical protein
MAAANARGLRVREAGVVVVGVESGRKVVAGGEGGVDGDGGLGPVVIACDNFDGARGPYNRKNQQIFASVYEKKNARENTDKV